MVFILLRVSRSNEQIWIRHSQTPVYKVTKPSSQQAIKTNVWNQSLAADNPKTHLEAE